MNHTYTCIRCPLGCQVQLTEDQGKIIKIDGSACKQGEKYAVEEFTNPLRMLTTTIKVEGANIGRLPVCTAAPIPKKLIRGGAKLLAETVIKAPVKCGQVILSDFLHTGVNLISSRDLETKDPATESTEKHGEDKILNFLIF